MSVDWKARALSAEREVRRLKKIEHAAWHALDNCGEYPDAEDPHVEMPWADYLALSKLLPEDHP